MSVVFKILNAAAPLAQSIIENVVDYKKLKAENEILAKQIDVLRKKLLVSTIVAVTFGIGFLIMFTKMLFKSGVIC